MAFKRSLNYARGIATLIDAQWAISKDTKITGNPKITHNQAYLHQQIVGFTNNQQHSTSTLHSTGQT